MATDQMWGVLLIWLGGLSAASFYVPFKRVRGWSWEVYWLVFAVFSWVVIPWLFASTLTDHLARVLLSVPRSTLVWVYLWGVIWGIGGVTYGLAVRYIGLSLGNAVILGLAMVIGTTGPLLFRGTALHLLATAGGISSIVGITLALLGVALVGHAGRLKERQTSNVQSDKAEPFDFRKGLWLALLSGLMSGGFAFGLDAGAAIRAATISAGTGSLHQGLPVLCVILAGGFSTSFIWCFILIWRNGTGQEWIGRPAANSNLAGARIPLLNNYALCALSGLAWYMQFFFYSMGDSQMGAFSFISWTLLMASIIVFSNCWGFALNEWTNCTRATRRLAWAGIFSLVLATAVIGVGSHFGVTR